LGVNFFLLNLSLEFNELQVLDIRPGLEDSSEFAYFFSSFFNVFVFFFSFALLFFMIFLLLVLFGLLLEPITRELDFLLP
jgi:hypothetical protein